MEINNNANDVLAAVSDPKVLLEKRGSVEEMGRGSTSQAESMNSRNAVDDVGYATMLLQQIVDAASPKTNLRFSVEEDLKRMVVAVRAVGSDEIIQQFPPEEFIAVAKFIASQNPDVVDEDFLKGVLFDRRL